MDPIDIVLAVIPQLSKIEAKKVAKALGIMLDCCADGHDYKEIKVPKKSSNPYVKTKVFCSRCGKTAMV